MGPGKEVLVLQELVLKQLQAAVQLSQSRRQCLRGHPFTQEHRDHQLVGGQAGRGLRFSPKPNLVLFSPNRSPVLWISSHCYPLLSTHSHYLPRPHLLLIEGQPPPLPASSHMAARGILLRSQSAHIFSLYKAFHGSHCPHHKGLTPRRSPVQLPSYPHSLPLPDFTNGNVPANPSGM